MSDPLPQSVLITYGPEQTRPTKFKALLSCQYQGLHKNVSWYMVIMLYNSLIIEQSKH